MMIDIAKQDILILVILMEQLKNFIIQIYAKSLINIILDSLLVTSQQSKIINLFRTVSVSRNKIEVN